MKQCKYCRAPLPEDALFCPFCEKALVEKQQLRAPRPRRRRRILALLLVLALLAGGFGLWKSTRPASQAAEPRETEPQEAEALDTESRDTEPQAAEPQESELPETEPLDTEPLAAEPRIYNFGAPAVDMQYTAADGVSYHLFLSVAETAEEAESCERVRLSLPESGKGHCVSLLCAVPEGAELPEGAAFAELMEGAYLRAGALGGSEPLELGEAAYDADRPFAAAAATLDYSEGCLVNELCWAVYMKNGDVIYLHQFVYVGGAADAAGLRAPVVDLWYAAEDGVSYHLYLGVADTPKEAWPRETVRVPAPGNGTEQFVSRLFAMPEGGTLSDGAAFAELIEQVDIRVANVQPGAIVLERYGVPHDPSLPFAAAAVTMDYDERWQVNELLWMIRMKNGDVIYLHQFIYAGDAEP